MKTKPFLFLIGTPLVIYLCIWQGIRKQALTESNNVSKLARSDWGLLDSMFNNAALSGGKPSSKGFLTIGIPCVHRPNNTLYLVNTLKSLLANTNDTEKKQITIVIFLADFDETVRLHINDRLLEIFGPYFTSGLIHTIQAPSSFYPSFVNLKRTYNHPLDRVKWRSKQNFDYAYLMMYSENLSEYYIQLEDDLITVPNYLSIIKQFMNEHKRWTCLEFCELGFIAKLYHSRDIRQLANMLMLFFNEQPCDVIYLHFNELMLQFGRYVRTPTIFQHRGYYSSLSRKSYLTLDLLFNSSSLSKPKSLAEKDNVISHFTNPVQRRQQKHIAGPEAGLWRDRIAREKRMKKSMVIL